MLHRNRSNHSAAPIGAPTTGAMLISLAHALPDPSCALGRAARAMAHRLQEASPRALRLEAAELLAQLLDATDNLGDCDDDDLLDDEFDA